MSENFFNKEWTCIELDFLYETHKNNIGNLIPIWYGIDEDYLFEMDERLAEIKAIKIDDNSVDNAVAELIKLFI